MNGHIVGHTEVYPRHLPKGSLRLRVRAGAWHLTEIGADNVGGIFGSLSSAMAYARDELRGVRGGRVVVEFDGAVQDGQPLPLP
jgi:hypothetical protein